MTSLPNRQRQLNMSKVLPNNLTLAELHVHVGGAVAPAIMWSIAHLQGIRLPTKDYWQFERLITVGREKKISWDDYHELFHWTELIQSSPEAMERSIYEIISGAYRKNNINLLEISFNPMLRNRGGERDLDHIIMGSIRGMDRACLEYPVKAGLIFLLDRRFTYRQNEIIVKKAVKYQNRGVVGIDIAGPKQKGFQYQDYCPLYRLCKRKGLGTTVHTGEDGSTEEMEKVVRSLRPQRIVHGVKAVYSQSLMRFLKKEEMVLSICPTSNLVMGVVKDIAELKFILRTFLENQVKFCINTDDPEIFGINLKGEFNLLIREGILTPEEIIDSNRWAKRASFLNPKK